MVQAFPLTTQSGPFEETLPPGKVLDLEPQLVRQTQQELRRTVAEITELAKQPLELDPFLSGFLPRVASAMLAIGVAVWRKSPEWELVKEYRFPTSLLKQDEASNEVGEPSLCEPSALHKKLLDRVARDRQPVLIPPGSLQSDEDGQTQLSVPQNPSSFMLLCAPAQLETSEEAYWLEIVMEPMGGPATLRGYLRFAAQMADLLTDYLRTKRLQKLEFEQTVHRYATQLLEFLASKPPSKLALRTFTDTIRNLCAADQAFLAVRLPKHDWRIVSGSGLESIDTQGTGHQHLVVLAESLRPDQSHRLKSWTLDGQASDGVARSAEILGASRIDVLRVFESVREPEAAVLLIVLWPQIVGMSAHEQLVPLSRMALDSIRPSWWQQLRNSEQPTTRWQELLKPSQWSRLTKRVSGALLAIASLFIPIPATMSSLATLHPATIQQIYAPSNGTVRTMPFDQGELVSAGQVILEIDDPQLTSQLDEARSQMIQIDLRRFEGETALRRGQFHSALERDQLESELHALESQKQLAHQRLQLLEQQQELLAVRAKFDGVIGTWNAKNLLSDRPVALGQPLLTIYDPKGPWYLETHVDEHKLPELVSSIQSGTAGQARAFLTSHPWQLFDAIFHSLDPNAVQADPKIGAQIGARFVVSANQLPLRHQGAAARVRVPIGYRPLGRVLFGDLFNSLWTKARMWI